MENLSTSATASEAVAVSTIDRSTPISAKDLLTIPLRPQNAQTLEAFQKIIAKALGYTIGRWKEMRVYDWKLKMITVL